MRVTQEFLKDLAKLKASEIIRDIRTRVHKVRDDLVASADGRELMKRAKAHRVAQDDRRAKLDKMRDDINALWERQRKETAKLEDDRRERIAAIDKKFHADEKAMKKRHKEDDQREKKAIDKYKNGDKANTKAETEARTKFADRIIAAAKAGLKAEKIDARYACVTYYAQDELLSGGHKADYIRATIHGNVLDYFNGNDPRELLPPDQRENLARLLIKARLKAADEKEAESFTKWFDSQTV